MVVPSAEDRRDGEANAGRTVGSDPAADRRDRFTDILDPSPKTVDSLQRLDLPAGVDIEIKIQQA